jgi:subtilase family serine protease
VQTSGKRGIPDVAYDGNPHRRSGVQQLQLRQLLHHRLEQYGGTSIGTPQWAALFAIANSERKAGGKTPLNQPQSLLYANAEADFHDITSGKNGSCGAQCTAGPGYDYVTGLGSPQANLLIPVLVAAP